MLINISMIRIRIVIIDPKINVVKPNFKSLISNIIKFLFSVLLINTSVERSFSLFKL